MDFSKFQIHVEFQFKHPPTDVTPSSSSQSFQITLPLWVIAGRYIYPAQSHRYIQSLKPKRLQTDSEKYKVINCNLIGLVVSAIKVRAYLPTYLFAKIWDASIISVIYELRHTVNKGTTTPTSAKSLSKQ